MLHPEAIPTHSSPGSPYVQPHVPCYTPKLSPPTPPLVLLISHPMFLATPRSYPHPFLPGFSLRPTPCSLLYPGAITTHSSPSSPYVPPTFLATPRSYPHPFLPDFSLRPTHVPCYTQKLSPPIPPLVLLMSHPCSLLYPGAITTHSSPSSPYVPPTFLATPRSYPHPFLPDFSLRPTHVPCYTQKLSPPIPPRVLLISHPCSLLYPGVITTPSSPESSYLHPIILVIYRSYPHPSLHWFSLPPMLLVTPLPLPNTDHYRCVRRSPWHSPPDDVIGQPCPEPLLSRAQCSVVTVEATCLLKTTHGGIKNE